MNLDEEIHTDVCIIGAGPVGLFSVFECGLLKMRCHLIDVLPQVGGQLSEIYPQKPIYDIPGYPIIEAQELISKLMDQIEPFKPTFSLGNKVNELRKCNLKNSFIIGTENGLKVFAKVVVIAGGLGCFEPRKPLIENLNYYEGNGVDYFIRNVEKYRDKNVVICGGGDSALDWTIHLSGIAKYVRLVHRSENFRASPSSVEKIKALSGDNSIALHLNSTVTKINGEDRLTAIEIESKDGTMEHFSADFLIPLFGLSPKLGPILDCNLNIHSGAVEVNTVDYSTNIAGIYAIGDINTYRGKLKLILSGFHEAALMAQSAYKIVYPDQKLTFKYTTVYGVNHF